MSGADMGTAEEEGHGQLQRIERGLWRSGSAAATTVLGRALGSVLEAGDVVVLTGDLGAGKTCLTGGVAAGLGDEGTVTSPTFTIMAVHDRGRIPLYHFDLYRLTDVSELDDVGIYDVLDDDGACLVEWGEAYADELGDDRLDVTLTREELAAGDANATGDEAAPSGEPARLVRAVAHGERAERLLSAWDERVSLYGGQDLA